jgi:hypothetical protein
MAPDGRGQPAGERRLARFSKDATGFLRGSRVTLPRAFARMDDYFGCS